MKSYLKIHFLEYLKLIPRKRAIILYSLLMLFLFVLVGLSPVNANILKYVDFKKNERLETCGTVTDIDGNVYETVLVAGECWIKSNLRVKHYRNGDPIPEIQDRQEWVDAKTGAWCYYDNDPANEEKYGLLYNFFAVEDPRGLAPEGWEVPPLCSYQNLMNLYGYEVSGDKIKDPNEWPVNIYDNPDNESGLTVIPAGIRSGGNPDFQGNGDWGNYVTAFWTRTKFSADLSLFASLRHDAPHFNLDAYSYQIFWGLSVRTTKIKEPTKDPEKLIPEEIFQCKLGALGNVYEINIDFQDLIDRPTCSNYWYYDSYLCYDFNNVKIFKTDISSEPLQQNDNFEYDVTYYLLLENESNYNSSAFPVNFICNVEYKAFVFKRPLSLAPEGDAEQFFCDSALIGDFIVTGEDLSWYDSEDSEDALADDLPLEDGKKYYVSQRTDGCESTERLEVTARVSRPLVPRGVPVQEFCHEAVIGDLEVEGDNIQWYDAEGTLLPLSAGLVHDTVYQAVSKEGDCESSSLEIRIILKNPIAPQTDAVQVFCNQAILSDLGAVGENIRWYKDQSLTVIMDAGTALENQESYFVTQTVDGCESSAVEVKVTINAPEKPTGDTDQEFCGSANLSDLEITGENIRWYSGQNDTQAINGNIALVDGRTYYATQTLHGCESAERLAVNIQIYRPDRPIGQIFQSVCAGSLLEELNVDGIGLTWYDVASGGNPISPTTLLEHGRSYFVSQIVGGCESERLRISVEILASLVPVAENQQVFCASSAPKVKNLFAVGEQILWYLSETGGNPVSEDLQLENGISYFASNFNAIGCESPLRKKVEVKIQVCEVEVYNLVTMDDNDKNACFKIKDIEYFPENRLEVFNRYGVLVYTQISYGQDGNFFYGMSNVSGVRDAERGLPTGNYLYVLTYKVPADGRMEKVSGYLHLINTKR